MSMPAVYGAVYSTASSASSGELNSGKKAVRHLENLPLLVATDHLESSSNDKWMPRFLRRAVARSVANRVAGLVFVATSAFLTSCVATLVKDDSFKLRRIETLFWRSLVSWLLTIAALMASGTKMKKLRVKKELRPALIWRCVTGCVAMTVSLFVLQELAESNATALTYLSPLLTFVLAFALLKEKPDAPTVVFALVSVVGAILVVRPAWVFGKSGSTDLKWYQRSMASYLTNFVFGEWLTLSCGVVVAVTQAGAYVALRRLHKLPHLIVLFYFLLTNTLVSLGALLVLEKGEFRADLATDTWLAILGTGALAFAEQLFLTRGFQFDAAGALAATRLLRVGCEYAWGLALLGTALNVWSVAGAAATALGVAGMVLRRLNGHWAARRSMRNLRSMLPGAA